MAKGRKAKKQGSPESANARSASRRLMASGVTHKFDSDHAPHPCSVSHWVLLLLPALSLPFGNSNWVQERACARQITRLLLARPFVVVTVCYMYLCS